MKVLTKDGSVLLRRATKDERQRIIEERFPSGGAPEVMMVVGEDIPYTLSGNALVIHEEPRAVFHEDHVGDSNMVVFEAIVTDVDGDRGVPIFIDPREVAAVRMSIWRGKGRGTAILFRGNDRWVSLSNSFDGVRRALAAACPDLFGGLVDEDGT